MDNEDEVTIELRLTDEEATFIQYGLGMMIAHMGDDIAEWVNISDNSMDNLCKMYDTKYGVMSLWRKVVLAMGVPEQAVIDVLNSNGSDNADE